MDIKLDPSRDDLPLMANTSHILVKHYVLDLDVDFEHHVIEGTIVLFFEPGDKLKKQSSSSEVTCPSESNEVHEFRMLESCHTPVTNTGTFSSKVGYNDITICGKRERDTSVKDDNHDNREQASGIPSSKCCFDTGNHGSENFLLVLDCCDLSVLKVEEVDVAAVPGIEKFTRSPQLMVVSEELRNQIVHELAALPADRWREQLDYYAHCSQAPGCGELLFATDTWSLQIRKAGARTATDFPRAIRIWYRTTPEGRSVTWTSDQSGRPCVYTMGSPINNRALFPCQEPPVAMSTWQATVRAAASFVVLMSGENSAKPTQLREGFSSWHYYVTMPMPASTFTIAVGSWAEIQPEACSSDGLAAERAFLPPEADFRYAGACGHMEYPCRFQNVSTTTQDIIPHRVFAPVSFRDVCQENLLQLIPACLSAAHSILGTHPFSRLDVLIVPANFPSLGMASPHLIFLSQSTLTGSSHLCGTRLCHEIAHAWFGLAIGARDWTEEWLSEGFATHLEDVFWAEAQQLAPQEAQEQQELRACLRWHRLRDEVLNSAEELQVLRPNRENTGHVSDSGASVVKHGLNPEKTFMQVHYLKDFLQMLLENVPEEKRLELSVENIFQEWLESSGLPKPLQRERQAGAECGLVGQVSTEVTKWIRTNQRPRKRKRRENKEVFAKLLPDQLVLLLERLLEQKTLHPQTLQSLQQTYRLPEQDAEVRHRWCELIVKHRYTKAYGQVERFLRGDQAMGTYLYGELMVSEDARQQQLARKCFELTKEQMDRASAQVVAEMLF
ncbi:aminopeptidase O isoform X2 [Elephas maximus indicus]|uniref:aminopeptidase O isoform X2 n=1 Tax=Elephas maximus indicus TaxID=99487 RepID=UPI002115FEC3|nr:aminopeptidase O isoform X2 [Elephas maximus indicus]